MPATKPKSACTRIQNLDHCTDPCTKVVPKKSGRRPYCRTKHRGRNGKGCAKGTRKASPKASTLKRRPSASSPKRATLKRSKSTYATIEQFQELNDRLAQVETKVVMMENTAAIAAAPVSEPESELITEPEVLAETMEPTVPESEEPTSNNEAEAAMADAASPEEDVTSVSSTTEEVPSEQQPDDAVPEAATESPEADPNATSSVTGAISDAVSSAPDPVGELGSSISDSISSMMSPSPTEPKTE